jgi:hypothetical protein
MIYLKRLLTEWNSCRVVRSIAGLSLITYGIQLHEWPVIIFGLAWLAAGLFSLQCCTANSCYTPENNRSLSADKPVDFEQIK